MKDLIDNKIRKKIVKVDNTSNFIFDQIMIHYKSGYTLSIIQGEYSFGGKYGLYETAPISPISNILHNDLKGHLTEEGVKKEIVRMSKYWFIDELAYWINILINKVYWNTKYFFSNIIKKVNKILDKILKV